MIRLPKILIPVCGLLFLLNSSPADAQILNDSSVLKLIREDVDLIYNSKYTEASLLFDEIKSAYPEHPLIYLIKGLIVYWEKYPLLPTDPDHELFEKNMRKCIDISEENDNKEYHAEYLLTNLCARGMLLMYYSDNDLTSAVIPLAISTYKHVMESFDYSITCPDLNYFTGLYDYYREAYPREYTVYRSLAILFPPGSLEKGLKELKTAASDGVVLSPESYYLLTWIYLNFENNYPAGLVYTKSLFDKYPENLLYRATYIKTLFLLKRYDEAEIIINASVKANPVNKFFRAQLLNFNGLLQEKKYSDYDLASEYYNKGINTLSFAGDYGNEFTAYAYFGLSRTCDARGEKHSKKIYRDKATKLAEFKKINFDK